MAQRTAPHVCIEPLESRIAPSVVISAGGRVAHYTDLDGDRVTITVSKGRLSPSDFVMSSEGATVPGGESLVMLDLSDDGGEFHRANLTLIATRTKLGGDGQAEVGIIGAGDGETDLGRVYVDGSLDRLVAGDANDGPRSPGVKALVVRDFTDTSDEVIGGIAKLRVGADFPGASTVNASLTGSSAGFVWVQWANNDSGFEELAIDKSVVTNANLTKTGAGTLTLNGSNTFTGGTLQLSGDPGAATNLSGTVTSVINTQSITSGVTLNSALTIDSGSLVKTGTGTLNLSGTGTFTGTTTVSGGTLQLGGTVSLTGAGNLVLNGTGTLTFQNGALVKTGTGTLVIGSGNLVSGFVVQGNETSLPIAGATISFAASATAGGSPTATIVLSNLDSATAPADSDKIEIAAGRDYVVIMQNPVFFQRLLADGWTMGQPVLDAAGEVVSIALTKSTPITIPIPTTNTPTDSTPTSTGSTGGTVNIVNIVNIIQGGNLLINAVNLTSPFSSPFVIDRPSAVVSTALTQPIFDPALFTLHPITLS